MDGQLLQVVNVEHIKLARAGAVIKTRLRNVLTGSIFDHSFRSADKYKTVRIDKNEATYLYSDGTHHHFMDTQTYDQVAVDEELLEAVLPLLKEGSVANLLRYQDRLILHRSWVQGRHGVWGHQAREARDRGHDPGAAVHPARRCDPRRHPNTDLYGASLRAQGVASGGYG